MLVVVVCETGKSKLKKAHVKIKDNNVLNIFRCRHNLTPPTKNSSQIRWRFLGVRGVAETPRHSRISSPYEEQLDMGRSRGTAGGANEVRRSASRS